MNGNAPAAGGAIGAPGGADDVGRRPFARKAATSGFSGPEVGICGGVLLAGIWGRTGICGGGVGCCREAVALMSSASVPGFRSC